MSVRLRHHYGVFPLKSQASILGVKEVRRVWRNLENARPVLYKSRKELLRFWQGFKLTFVCKNI